MRDLSLGDRPVGPVGGSPGGVGLFGAGPGENLFVAMHRDGTPGARLRAGSFERAGPRRTLKPTRPPPSDVKVMGTTFVAGQVTVMVSRSIARPSFGRPAVELRCGGHFATSAKPASPNSWRVLPSA